KGIQNGTISLAFRQWKKQSIREGTLLHTSIGLIKILNVEVVNDDDITKDDAANAGYESKAELLQSFRKVEDGKINRISVQFHAPDPRIELREKIHLTDTEYEEIQKKLNRLDTHSNFGDWTKIILTAIHNNPKKRA